MYGTYIRKRVSLQVSGALRVGLRSCTVNVRHAKCQKVWKGLCNRKTYRGSLHDSSANTPSSRRRPLTILLLLYGGVKQYDVYNKGLPLYHTMSAIQAFHNATACLLARLYIYIYIYTQFNYTFRYVNERTTKRVTLTGNALLVGNTILGRCFSRDDLRSITAPEPHYQVGVCYLYIKQQSPCSESVLDVLM